MVEKDFGVLERVEGGNYHSYTILNRQHVGSKMSYFAEQSEDCLLKLTRAETHGSKS